MRKVSLLLCWYTLMIRFTITLLKESVELGKSKQSSTAQWCEGFSTVRHSKTTSCTKRVWSGSNCSSK